jgi:hypothetical protein
MATTTNLTDTPMAPLQSVSVMSAPPPPALAPPPEAFVAGCVPVRLLLAYLVATGVPDRARAPAAVAAAAVGVGFLVIHAMGWRKSGPETSGRPIWWDHLRPVHGVLYLAAAVLVAAGHDRAAAAVLLGDAAVGVVATVRHHYTQPLTPPPPTGEKN